MYNSSMSSMNMYINCMPKTINSSYIEYITKPEKRKLINDTIDIALSYSDRNLYFHLLPVDIYKHILYMANLL